LLFTTVAYCQKHTITLPQNDELITGLMKLSQQQLLDTAAQYFKNQNSMDTALICCKLIINHPVKDSDIEQQKRLANAYNRSAVIYKKMGDYKTAYELFIKSLVICEKVQDTVLESKIYNNIGNIYCDFKRYDMAKSYYIEALKLTQDPVILIFLLNNLGIAEMENGMSDSAFYYFDQALQLSKENRNNFLHGIFHNIAKLYHNENQFDSALYYYRLSLEDANKHNMFETQASALLNLGKLFFDVKKTDSALVYINLSIALATDQNFNKTLADAYLALSEIEESKGQIKKSFEHYKIYSNLKDSVFNTDIFGDINQLQQLYENAKSNQKIEQLMIEQQIKERTIHYQQIIWFITLCVLFIVSIGLVYIYFQKKNLNRAYKALFEKNLQIIELHENQPKKKMKSMLSDAGQRKLLDKILTLMEDTSVICDTEFTIDKIAELLQSNRTYVSQVINTALKKNFRTLLNEYRIREAQRIFSNPDAAKYTIESIALKVGYKSQTTFYEAFKEITGVSPSFYLKAMQKELV
jgi:AraC-like DNA-binding protein/Tfp pilus assembly protein PilF